ncbi:DUF551 domain-containing protein [Sporomusa sphaeroides]|uniref:DUF551 domain-containing protein n=1 Tax=Sporomusa sphaeroides TaxID=47679 RepID=UPI003DA1B9B5
MKPDTEAIQARAEKATPGPWKSTNSVIMAYGKCDTCDCDVLLGVAKTYETTDYDQDGRIFELQGNRKSNANFIAYARQDIPALLAYIAELEAERQWVPVSERLPEEGQRVDVVTKSWGREINYRFTNDEFTYGEDFFVAIKGEITHWMPTPLPPLPEVPK